MQLNITLLQVEFSPTPFKNTTKLRSFVMRKKRGFDNQSVVLYFYCNIEFHFIKQKK